MIDYSTVPLANPVYKAADGSVIDCTLTHPVFGALPFTVVEGSDGPGQAVLFARLEAMSPAAYIAPDPVVPFEVTKLQLIRALRAAGLLSAVQAALDAGPASSKEDWEAAHKIERADPLIVAFAGALGLTEGEADALFIAAAST